MSLVFDPVWPWSLVWEILVQIPPGPRAVAGLAMLAALLLPIFQLARAGRAILYTTITVLFMACLLVSQHAWTPILALARTSSSSGWTTWPMALVWQVVMILLLIGPPMLAGFSVGTYIGTPGVHFLRLASIALLRLLAFLFALCAVLRPALAIADREAVDSRLMILVDRSRSMTVQDELGKQSRWDLLRQTLTNAEPVLERLRENQQIAVQMFSFGDEVKEWTPGSPGEPDAKRTDFGGGLRSLFDRRDVQIPLRGLLVLSDGADNGSLPALAEAQRWRSSGATITTFASGNPGTAPQQNDVAITTISTAPTPFVPVKGKLTVKLNIDARGYENTRARVRLFMESEGQDKEVLGQDVVLPLSTGNEITLVTTAPAQPGEVKIKAVVETSEPDDFPQNNTIETFITVSKEGISVLLVDRQRAHEPQFLCDALSQDPRIRMTTVWVRGSRPAGAAARLNVLDDQPFDVILLGDVTAGQLRAVDPQFFTKIEKHLARGAGLMVLGGYVNLGNGNWGDTELERALPVDLTFRQQVDKPVRMLPTEDGLRRARYILRLDDNPDLKQAWEKLAKLDGATVLRLPEPRRGLETVLATTDQGDPLLVSQLYGAKKDNDAGAARILVFGGDTTYRWVRDEESQRLHERFWRQVIVWLARQEETEGSVWVRPDVRRLPARTELGFAVGMRGKEAGADIRDGNYQVEVTMPDGRSVPVALQRGADQTRGVFAATNQAGVYKITVKGEGKDASGNAVSGQASARVIVYEEDLELIKPAADPEFLQKLATAGGGEAFRIEQLIDYLNRLAEETLERETPAQELLPDWRTTNRSPFLVAFFLGFTLLVSMEWALRRLWGMV